MLIRETNTVVYDVEYDLIYCYIRVRRIFERQDNCATSTTVAYVILITIWRYASDKPPKVKAREPITQSASTIS